MKNILYILFFSVVVVSCQNSQGPSTTYTPRILTENEKFNEYLEGKDSAFTLSVRKDEAATSANKEEFNIKYKDTVISILINKADPSTATDKFAFAQFVNTQKTTLLVQISDNSGLAAPYYIITLKNGKPEVVSLYRASSGKEDSKYTKGAIKIGRGGYLINNDFFITNVNAQVYLIKRQNPEERIQGEFILNSPDRSTLVFLLPSSLYQVNYPSDEVTTQPVSKAALASTNVSDLIKSDYIWEKNKKGITFLKYNDSNRIVDIKEFN